MADQAKKTSWCGLFNVTHRRRSNRQIPQQNDNFKNINAVQSITSNPDISIENAKITSVNSQYPDDYRQILEPIVSTKRMNVLAELPRNLTPKGYAKMRLTMSIGKKQFEIISKQCIQTGTLWEDPDFPANNKAIGSIDQLPPIEWKRPKDINSKAVFLSGDANRFDIEQGQLGDCWLLAVVSSITSYSSMFEQVVPPHQFLRGPNYTGMVRFRFWRFGQWIEVMVDDRLPCRKGTKKLLFMHSNKETEFWSALLEKAYAKLNGTYANLSGGTQSEAMEDLTGGMCESIELNTKATPVDLASKMEKYLSQCCLMGCSAESDVVEAKLPHGLIGGHAYSVTALNTVTYKGKSQRLVRCRNPWGGEYEWTGPWSDKSKEWKDIPQNQMKDLKHEDKNDGEFWMSFEDFCTNFSKLEVCHLGLESLESNDAIRGMHRLEEVVFVGEWIKGVNAGGCLNNQATFWTNPQYRITLEHPDPNDSYCSVVIGLMQKDVRQQTGGIFFDIGFVIYKVPNNAKGQLDRMFFRMNKSIGVSAFSNSREEVKWMRLAPGSYVIVPSTFTPNLECKFIVRVLSQVPIKKSKMDNDNVATQLSTEMFNALNKDGQNQSEVQHLKNMFNEMVTRSGEIKAHNLVKLLNSSSLKSVTGFVGFNLEVCRSMIAAMDTNHTGGLDYSEFNDLWSCCVAWKTIFEDKDSDKSGTFSSYEFREALDAAGYKVSHKVFHSLVQRYTNELDDTINFEDFILCMFRIKNAFDITKAQPKNADGNSNFVTEDYLRFAVYT